MPDANVAAKWFLEDEADLEAARDLARRERAAELAFVAPDCFYYEFGNIIRTAERRERITRSRGDVIIRDIDAIPMTTAPSRLLLPAAFARSRELEISLYDAFYLVTTEMLGATFITADDQLFARLGGLAHVRRL